VSAVPTQPAGAGRYTVDLVDALARRGDVALVLWARRGDAQRWRSLVAGTPAEDEHRVRAVVPVHRPARLAWEQLRLPALLAAGSADVHHGPHYTMPERARLPVVVTVHDMTFFDHPEWHERAKVPVFRRAIRRAAALADALVCVSQVTAERLHARVEPKGRVFVVPHGVDHRRFCPDEPTPGADTAELLALGVRMPYVLFLGTLEPRKAVPDLVAAFASIADRHPELGLVLAGQPGWGSEEIDRALAVSPAAAGSASRVLRTGYLPDETVPALLRRAAVVAYPARQEGFGLPALEALACGAPLVTSAGTAMAELAADAALLVPPGDVDALAGALDEALAGGPAAVDRRRRGIEVAALHTWERSAEGHLTAYRWAFTTSGRSADGAGPDGR
jgi:glycosyltransferase involved in cell wall biosynthesis